MPKKLHLYKTAEIARSVLEGVEIAAVCGRRKILTRDDIDAAKDASRKPCEKCHSGAHEMSRDADVLIRKSEGWTRFLERQYEQERQTRVTSSVTQKWTFPLAG